MIPSVISRRASLLSRSAFIRSPRPISPHPHSFRPPSAPLRRSVGSTSTSASGSAPAASARLPGTSKGLATLSEISHPTSTLAPIHLPKSPIMSSPFPPVPPLPKAKGPIELILPPTEDRPHKYFVLDNGMEVVVVSDPKADKAAAAMDVGVGHLSDPDDLPGCAHFCEHLLFMGTKKYPSENEYSTYLSSNNGHSNAWTAMTSTTYYFDVGKDALEGALDRFSGFFYEPLFNDDCTEREIKAVDSEHKKNLQNDLWRFFQLEKHAFRTDHAYHKFGTGNYETLWSKPKEAGRDPRKQLMEWWEKEYCARRMKLAIIGKEDVETLEKWAREKFAKVPVRTEGLPPVGKEGVRVVFEESPMGPAQMGVVTFTRPVKDNRGLEMTFPMPDLSHLVECKPSNYIIHFLGHEGHGSILSYLKKKGWVNYLRAGLSHGAAGFEFFKITTDLTPDGLQNWKQVALVIYKYISLLRSAPPSSQIFDELRTMAEISFRFAEKSRPDSYATELSGGMQEPVPREKIVSAKYVLDHWREDEVRTVLALLDPRRSTIGITCRELPKDVEGVYDKKEPIYGTEYHQIRWSEEFEKEAMSGAPIPELGLPGTNPFIPERLDVEKFPVTSPSLRPELLRDTELSRLWYKRDDTFWIPKANLEIKLASPLLNITPRNNVLTNLLVELFSDAITEEIYNADLAELSFRLYSGNEWLGVMARGFSDKLAVLTETMLTRLMQFEVDEARFKEVVDQLKLHWGNFSLNDPYRQISFWDIYAIQEVGWTPAEKLAELEHISPADLKVFGREVFSRLFIESLIHGNMAPEDAKKVQDMLERIFSARPITESEKNTVRSLILPPSSEHIWNIDIPNKAEVNSAITYHLHIGDPTDTALKAQLQLFDQLANEPTFDKLRTKEQLGYIVASNLIPRTGAMGWRVLIQSEKEPIYLETRIEAFLESLKKIIEDMSDEEFEKHRGTLIAKREEKPKNLGEETKRFWGRITDRYYEFGKRQTEIAALQKTTKADVLNMFMTYIHPSSTTRAKLSTHLKSQYNGVKFDPASAAPLVGGFTKHGIPIEPAALQKLMATQPDLQTVKDFALKVVAGAPDLTAEARSELEGIINGLAGKDAGSKSPEEAAAKVRESNVWIKDIATFKAGLLPGKAAVPVEPIKANPKL